MQLTNTVLKFDDVIVSCLDVLQRLSRLLCVIKYLDVNLKQHHNSNSMSVNLCNAVVPHSDSRDLIPKLRFLQECLILEETMMNVFPCAITNKMKISELLKVTSVNVPPKEIDTDEY